MKSCRLRPKAAAAAAEEPEMGCLLLMEAAAGTEGRTVDGRGRREPSSIEAVAVETEREAGGTTERQEERRALWVG